VRGNGTSVGTGLQLWSCLGHANQLWTAAFTAELASPPSGLCLSDPGAAARNGTKVELGRCLAGARDGWTLPAGEIMSGLGKCVTDSGGGTANGTKIVLETCADSSAQRWTFNPDGSIRIFGKCLSLTSAAWGATALLESCGDAYWWQWSATEMDILGAAIQGPGASYLEAPEAANGTQLALGESASPWGDWYLW
jgi:hypothetical protein